jgi:hypothetical protein
VSTKEFTASLWVLAVSLPIALELRCKIGGDAAGLIWPDMLILQKEMLLFLKT